MPLVQITQEGVLTHGTRVILNDNFTQLSQAVLPDFWVNPQYGNNSNLGTQDKPFADMTGLSGKLSPGDVVALQGVLFQQWDAPFVNDITIVGWSTQPRQATSSNIPNGGGATWMSPLTGISNTSALIKVHSQGWRFSNLFFNNAATTAPCVELFRDGETIESDASHASFYGCKFTGTDDGIWDNGGASFVTINGCDFYNFAGSGDTALKTGGASVIALPLQWQIVNNRFFNNANHITLALSSGNVQNNVFGYIGSSITTTTQITLTGGKNNTVWQNKFGMAPTLNLITAMFAGGTADSWGPNMFTAGLATYGSDIYGVPAT